MVFVQPVRLFLESLHREPLVIWLGVQQSILFILFDHSCILEEQTRSLLIFQTLYANVFFVKLSISVVKKHARCQQNFHGRDQLQEVGY